MLNDGFDGHLKPNKNTHSKNQAAEKTPANSFRQLFKKFASDTTFGGVSKATFAESHFRRLVWSLISATCYGFTIYMCYLLIVDYLDKPITTSVDIIYEKNMDFPSITVCNFNQFRYSKVKYLPSIIEALKSFEKRGKNESTTFENSFNKKTKALKKDVSINSDIDDDEVSSLDDVEIDEGLVIEEIVASIAAEYSEEDLTTVGHQFKDTIISCTWMGVNCKEGYFKKFWTQSWNWKFGNCFTFNPGANETGHKVKLLRTTMPGPNYGISLDINVEQAEYINELVDEAGVKMVIHVPGQMPFPYDDGITLPPGFSSSVAIRKESITRVDPFKNGTCNSAKNIASNNVYRKYHAGSWNKYTVKACMQSCLARDQLRQCNCSSTQFAQLVDRVCKEEEELSCLAEVNSRYKNDQIGCSQRCPQACFDESYRYSVMMSSLTSQAKESKKKNFGENKTDDDFNNNFLRVKVFFDELNLHKIVQSTEYGIDNLLGDIGGQLGLWIGISVISVAEFGELLISLIIVAVRKTRAHKKTKNSEMELQ